MTLAEFLSAQYAENEATAGRYHRFDCLRADLSAIAPPCTCGHADQIRAECEAKRRILARHGDEATESGCPTCWWDDADHCPTLRILAAVYADHPDYREEWKP